MRGLGSGAGKEVWIGQENVSCQPSDEVRVVENWHTRVLQLQQFFLLEETIDVMGYVFSTFYISQQKTFMGRTEGKTPQIKAGLDAYVKGRGLHLHWYNKSSETSRIAKA